MSLIGTTIGQNAKAFVDIRDNKRLRRPERRTSEEFSKAALAHVDEEGQERIFDEEELFSRSGIVYLDNLILYLITLIKTLEEFFSKSCFSNLSCAFLRKKY